MPLLSIIIPSFNSNKSLQACIESIRGQSLNNYEVYVIDAKSTDGTLDYLKTLDAPFYWISEHDKGIYDAMNKGIDLSKGEWLYFIGADDRVNATDTFKTIFNSKIQEDISIIIGRITYNNMDKNSHQMNKVHNMFALWSPKLWIKNTPHHQGILYRRAIFNTFKYDLNYKILSDYDLNLKLFRHNYKPKLLDMTIAVCGGGGISKQYNWLMYKEEIKLKTMQSSILLKPIFYTLAITKYLIKKY